jgi:hypothetical protein
VKRSTRHVTALVCVRAAGTDHHLSWSFRENCVKNSAVRDLSWANMQWSLTTDPRTLTNNDLLTMSIAFSYRSHKLCARTGYLFRDWQCYRWIIEKATWAMKVKKFLPIIA